jgi:hypothetical protein
MKKMIAYRKIVNVKNVFLSLAMLVVINTISAQQTVQYPYGIMPTNANYEDAKAIYDRWVAVAVNADPTQVPNTSTMLRVGTNDYVTNEYMGHGMLNVAMFDPDDTRLRKMFNFVKRYHNGDYMMKWKVENKTAPYNNSAADGAVDVAMACIIASKRWPNSGVVDTDLGLDWEGIAKKKINNIKSVKATPGAKVNAIRGVQNSYKYYINYFPFAFMPLFEKVTGDSDWQAITDGCYEVMEYSYNNYVLPAWFVDDDGVMRDPNEASGVGQDRWYSGSARTGWRVPQHYFWTQDARSEKWAIRINDLYVANGLNDSIGQNIGWGYYTSDGTQYPPGEGQNSYMAGAAGMCAMVVGNQAGTDNAWDWLSSEDKYITHSEPKDLHAMIHVLYVGIMAGLMDCSTSDFYLNVTPNNFSLAKEATTKSVSITSNTNWTVSSNQSWATPSPTSGSGDGSVTITIDENTGDFPRDAIVTLSSTDANDATVEISQVGSLEYNLSTSAVNGSINLDPAGGVYAPGTVVTATAVPVAGYEFDSWSGSITGSNNPVDITMDGNKSITASFVESVFPQAHYTENTITIDGSINEADWDLKFTLENTIDAIGSSDNTTTFGILWDNTNLYFAGKVLDANLYNDPGLADHVNDGIELYLDLGNEKASEYDNNDYQILKLYNSGSEAPNVSQGNAISGIEGGAQNISGGYTIEMAIPWASTALSGPPSMGDTIGIDVGNNDNDNGSGRTGQLMWYHDVTNTNWSDPSGFGEMMLLDVETGILNSIASKESISVSPNPVSTGLINISAPAEVTIFSLAGVPLIQEYNSQTIDVSGLNSGVYIVKLSGEAFEEQIKLIVE